MVEALSTEPKKDALQRVQFGNFDIMNDAEGRPLALGKGTFGRTYQARHRYLDTIVALKIINERYATDAGVRQRFLVEARAVARLSHPHVARLYDFGEVDGVLHYAMEFCGGRSLADYVAKNGPLELQQIVEVGQQIAGALKCAHAAGFIHRDLKPSNIMLTEPKGPLFSKLIDFGLVQPSLPETTASVGNDQSADGARFLGTPLFASPEQLKEEPMDIRTDLFSLGMTLWFLALGRAPEGGSSAEIAARRLSPESYAKQLPANLPSQLRDVLARLLQKDRRNRFASASEVFAAFNTCAAALGFRRARDYTSAAEPTEWEESAPATAPEQAATAEPAEIEQVEANLDSEFKIVTRINDDLTGSNYLAESKASGALVFLHVLHPALVEDASTFELLRVHMTQLKALNAPEILQPQALRSYSDYVSIVIDRPAGGDLLSILRTERVVNLVEAAPLLESIAAVCDGLAAAGLPGPQLAPAYIFVDWPDGGNQPNGGASARQLGEARPKLYPRFLAVSEAPELARLNEPEDASSTMTSDMLGDPSRADNICEHFGILLYRIVAGRNCPIAASLSSQAYIPVPSLSEQANRTLALVIAKQIAVASCGQVLREIFGAEGIAPRLPGHPSAGFTASGTGSTVVPPSATPPSALRTPSKTSTASSRFRPMPVAPSAAGAPPPLIIPPPLVVLPPPAPEPAEAAGALLAEVEEAPAAEAPKPPPPARETTPPKIAAKKSRPSATRIQPADAKAKEEQARPEPPAQAAPSPLEAVTLVDKKIVAPPIPVSPPKVAIPPVPVIPKPSIAQNVVPWVGRNIRSIGIGIAALLVVSVAYGFIQKSRSTGGTNKTTTSSNTQHDAPVLEPAKEIVPTTAAAPTAAGTDAEQDKINANRLRAEQQADDEAKLAAQKAAEEARLSAERLAEKEKTDRANQTKPAPPANATVQEAPKVRSTQKQAQKDSQSSGRTRTNTTSQSTNRPAPVAPAPRPPPVQRPASNPQRPRSEFGPSAPGG
jgi:serine/threonine protein kinase